MWFPYDHIREEGEEYKLKLSDVHLALAEVAMESGMLFCAKRSAVCSMGLFKDQYQEAVEDLKTCLSIREAYVGLNNRQLAEVYVMPLSHTWELIYTLRVFF